MKKKFRSKRLLSSIVSGLMLLSQANAAENEYEIEAGSLANVIGQVSETYQQIIITDNVSIEGIEVQSVSGYSSLLEALNAALAESSLYARRDDNGAIIIGKKKLTTSSFQSNGTIENIVVTAQKSIKNLQEMGSSISVLGGEELSKNNINNAFDLSDRLPSLVVSSVQGYRPTVSIRGVGNEIPDNAGTKQAVAYHIDGVFMANDYALLSDLFDVEQIELTRGPDGTLYGNSSTGGAINVITNRPDHNDNFGFVEAAIGNYEQRELKALLNAPLSETIALRIAGSKRENKGYAENRALDNYRMDDTDNQTLRAQLGWSPNEDVNIVLSHIDFSSDTNGPALKGGFDNKSDDPRVVYHDTPEFFKLDNSLTSIRLDWDTSFATVNTIVSKQKYDMRRRLDFDRSDLTANDPAPLALEGELDLLGEAPIPQFIGNLHQTDNSYTAEINLISPKNDDKFEWVVGAFWLDTEIFSRTSNFVDADRDGDPISMIIAGPNVFANNSDIDFINSDNRNFNSYAVFGQTSYAISPTLGLVTGLRYTNNKFEDERCSLNCVPNRSPITSTPANETDNITGKLAIEYLINEDIMTFASIANGIKPAGSNSSTDLRFFPEVFEQEEVIAYEVGIKSDLFDSRLRFNVGAFYYDYSDYLFESSGIGRFNSGASNLPKAEIYGLELETGGYLTESLTFDLSASLMGSEITEGRDAIDRAVAENQSVGLIIVSVR